MASIEDRMNTSTNPTWGFLYLISRPKVFLTAFIVLATGTALAHFFSETSDTAEMLRKTLE